MIRTALLTASLALAGPAMAASLSAVPASPAKPGRIIAGATNWACGAAACQVATDQSRPLVLCQDLAKKTGRIAAFTVDGRAFGTDELAKCNRSVRDTGTALAKAD